MLRLIFVAGIIAAGIIYSFRSPFYILLFYLWNAYFRPELWVWTDVISPLRLSWVLGVALVFTAAFRLNDFRLTGRLVLLLLFFLQSIVSLSAAVSLEWSWVFWLEFTKVVVIAASMTFLVRDRTQFRLTLLVVAFSLGLEAVKQGWAQLILNPGGQNNNPHPVLGDNNGMAVGMMMLVPILVALAQTSPGWRERYVHRMAIIGAFYRGVSTYSRGGFLTAIVVGGLMLWRSPHRIRASIAIAIVAVTVASVMPDTFWDRMGTIVAPAEQRDASQRGRLYFWQVAVVMANANPLSGIGFNGYRQAFPHYDFSGGTWGDDRAVHSTWFGVLAEMGYPGLFLFVAIILAALGACRTIRRQTRGDPGANDIHAFAIALQTSLIGYTVGMTFLNGQYNGMYWHLIGLSIALERINADYQRARLPSGVGGVAAVGLPEARTAVSWPPRRAS